MRDIISHVETPDGLFHDGDPSTGAEGTVVHALWLNAIQSAVIDTQTENKNILAAAGIQPKAEQNNQIIEAINSLILQSLKEDSRQSLLKKNNGADIPDKTDFVKNLGLSNTVEQAKNALDKRTGGTVNGDVIVEGSALSLKGDNRKHLGFHNQDGSVRMWLYKDKGGDGVHLNNGEDGGGDWLFHKNGNLHAPAGIFAGGNVTVSWGGRSAIFHENGDVTGPIWGGALSAWANNRVNDALHTSADFSVDGDNWWFRDNRRGLIFQGGYRDGQNSDRVIERVGLNIHVPNRLLYVGTTIVNFSQGFDTSWNHQVANVSGEKDGFTWIHGRAEQKMYWMAVGY